MKRQTMSSIHIRNESNKKSKRSHTAAEEISADFFDKLPDDLVVAILCKLSSTAASPADFIASLITCKRICELGKEPLVLSKASAKALAVRATNWSESADLFFRRCIEAGNLDACYTLGMIQFYCLDNHTTGISLMETAANGSHAAAQYSLAVIFFLLNSNGGSEDQNNLRILIARTGALLCGRAAVLGHVNALRELGLCFTEGRGLPQIVARGWKLLIKANTLELATMKSTLTAAEWMRWRDQQGPENQLFSRCGYDLPAVELDPVNRFLTEWFEERGCVEGLRGCFNGGCGRREVRHIKFARCFICQGAYYCSRACQAIHWRQGHKNECTPVNGLVGVPAAQLAMEEG